MRWVGLVRNVMLGREGLHREVLLGLTRDAGGTDPRSFLTTGNVTFTAEPDQLADVVDTLETAIAGVLGRREVVVVRSMDWLGDLVAADPFRGYERDAFELEVCFVPHTAPPLVATDLPDSRPTGLVEVRDHELLTARPHSRASLPHGNRLLERATGQPATARAWSTLQRIHAHDHN